MATTSVENLVAVAVDALLMFSLLLVLLLLLPLAVANVTVASAFNK